ncbi:MAG: hypothetical protein U0Q12_10525 [Vicinamibacterales bacterium]
MTLALLSGALAFLASVLLTAGCKPLARQVGAVAIPRNDRWHRQSIPLLGGLAIMGATVVATLATQAVGRAAWVVLGGALTLGLVGIVDDLRPIKPQTKFIAQILVASALVAAGYQLRLSGMPLVDVLLTLIWLVGITNAFNLLDNMDGLAAGVAAITLVFRLVFCLGDGNLEGAALCGILAGAALGFLVHNFNPASIFMGDAGSLFLGLAVGGASLVDGYAYSKSTLSVLLFPVLLLSVPIFDTTLVTLARILARRPISMGGRDHTSHRLVALGLSERQAVSLLYVVSLAAGAVALFAYRYGLSSSVVLISFLGIGLIIFGKYLSHLKVYPESHARTDDAGTLLSLVADFSYKRQVGMVVMDMLLIVLAYHSAYLLRFEQTFAAEEPTFLKSLPVVMSLQLLALALSRVYQGVWRYTGVHDLFRLTQGVVLGTGGSVIVLVFVYRFAGFSRTVFVLDALLLLVFLSGSRLSMRALGEFLRPSPDHFRRALIYGAGDGGALVLREIRNNPRLELLPVGFLDDDRTKHRTSIQGTPVLGGAERLEELVARHAISEVVIASSKIEGDLVDRLTTTCDALGVRLTRATLSVR